MKNTLIHDRNFIPAWIGRLIIRKEEDNRNHGREHFDKDNKG
jgi:hypothetical protein